MSDAAKKPLPFATLKVQQLEALLFGGPKGLFSVRPDTLDVTAVTVGKNIATACGNMKDRGAELPTIGFDFGRILWEAKYHKAKRAHFYLDPDYLARVSLFAEDKGNFIEVCDRLPAECLAAMTTAGDGSFERDHFAFASEFLKCETRAKTDLLDAEAAKLAGKLSKEVGNFGIGICNYCGDLLTVAHDYAWDWALYVMPADGLDFGDDDEVTE